MSSYVEAIWNGGHNRDPMRNSKRRALHLTRFANGVVDRVEVVFPIHRIYIFYERRGIVYRNTHLRILSGQKGFESEYFMEHGWLRDKV